MECRPRKTLPIETPTVYDHARWRQPNTSLSPEDNAWKLAWLAHTGQMFRSLLETPNSSTCASWIEPDITFMLAVSLLDQ